jgi:peptidyl-prolyl cis-trans isomerase SurA
MRKSLAILAAVLAIGTAIPSGWATAQEGLFAPVLTVNGRVVTGFELDQRMKFLTVIGQQGDIQAEAEKLLIEDRIRQDMAKRMGIRITAEQVKAGMEEFASRANLSAEQFLEAIGQGGVDPETFRDFVASGLLWREVVRARFAGRISVSEADIDRAISVTAKRGEGPRVLLSEIIMPVRQGGAGPVLKRATELTEEIGSEAEFAAAARANSAAPSRENGGQIGWIPVTNLPAQIRPVLLGLRPGQISPPLPVPGGIAIFRVRGLDQGGEISSGQVTVEYAELLIPGGRSDAALAEAARIRGKVDTCDDLNTVARGMPEARLTQQKAALTALPGDVAREIAALDEGEASTALTRGNALVFLMLCARTATEAEGGAPDLDAAMAAPRLPDEDGDLPPRVDEKYGFGAGPSREAVRQDLINAKVSGLADAWLAELVGDAVITRP